MKKPASAHATVSRGERIAAGKALRDKCSRRSQATWKPASHRRDPIDLLTESSEGRLPQLVPIRYGRMMQSPFAFYRGAAAIMAADLAHTPRTGIRVQACGDCHLLNFGGYATPERRLVFDINDFDETLPAPWEWDLKRLAASFVIAGLNNGFWKADAREAAVRATRGYREHMHELARMRVLERWYTRLDLEALLGTVKEKAWRRHITKYIAKAAARSVAEDDFPKLADVRNGHFRIKDNPPLIFHQTKFVGKQYDQMVKDAFQRYRATLSDDRQGLLDNFEIQDIAVKVVGVGSVGTRCGILLLMAGNDDPFFLQVKEARTSVLEPYAGRSRYRNRGQRVVEGQRLMQAASDMFLGWTEGREGDGHHFYIRQLRDIKIKPVVEAMNERRLFQYASWCGWTLARAHANSSDSAMIAGYLGNSDRFDEAMGDFAVAYAKQNERDHDALLKAIRAGRLKVLREDS